MGYRKHGDASLGHTFPIRNKHAIILDARGVTNRMQPRYKRLTEDFRKRPALKAVNELPGSDSTSPTAAALLAYTIANKDFSVIGTNMTTALCTFVPQAVGSVAGGINMQTAGADADQAILLPSLSTGITAWGSVIADIQPRFEVSLRTSRPLKVTTAARSTTTASITTSVPHNLSVGQSVTVALLTGPTGYAALNGTYLVTGITSTTVFTYTTTTTGTVNSGAATGLTTINTFLFQTIWAGLKKTNTDVIATDDDQFYMRYLSTENSGAMQIITSRAGVDVTTVLPVLVQPNTNYRIIFKVSDTRIPSVEVNGVEYNLVPGSHGQTGSDGSAALTSNVALIPYTGTAASGAANTKAIDVLEYDMQVAA